MRGCRGCALFVGRGRGWHVLPISAQDGMNKGGVTGRSMQVPTYEKEPSGDLLTGRQLHGVRQLPNGVSEQGLSILHYCNYCNYCKA